MVPLIKFWEIFYCFKISYYYIQYDFDFYKDTTYDFLKTNLIKVTID